MRSINRNPVSQGLFGLTVIPTFYMSFCSLLMTNFLPPTIFATAYSQKLDNYANSDESLMWIDLHTLRLEPYESFCEYSERRYSRT